MCDFLGIKKMRNLEINLKVILAQRKMTMKALSEGTGISLNSLSIFANNKVREFPKENLEKICDFLDCDISDLLFFEKKTVLVEELGKVA